MGFNSFGRDLRRKSEEESRAATAFNQKRKETDQETELKSEKERLEQFLDERLAELIEKAKESEHPEREEVCFWPQDVKADFDEIKNVFLDRAQVSDENGKRSPRAILGDKQLSFTKEFQEHKDRGERLYTMTYKLGLEAFSPEKPIEIKEVNKFPENT